MTRRDDTDPAAPPPADQPTDVTRVAGMLADARSVICLTGAGVSAESDIPTFRDAMTGLWASFDPMTLATPEAFDADPETVSKWYDFRREKCRDAEPNPGHIALARIEKELTSRGGSFTLVTQNVDGLHRRAGSIEVVEIHGSLETWRDLDTHEEFGPDDLPCPFESYPPESPSGGTLRPGVVWFGEMLPEAALEKVDRALRTCDLFLSIGTSAVVYPAAGFASAAASRGASVVEINLDPTPSSGSVDVSIRAKSGQVLPIIADTAFRSP